MLFGGWYKLRTATVAVDCNRIAMQIPAEAVVQVTSHSTNGNTLVEVAWEGRAYMIFAVDLMERGDLMTEAKINADGAEEQVRQALHQEVRSANERREHALQWFSQVINDIPSGIPSPDGTDRIRQASRAYSHARKALSDAVTKLNNFLVHGTIPPGLERKPVTSEKLNSAVKKAGAE